MSVQVSKAGAYTYFFCLARRTIPTGTCREPYVPADKLEAEALELYQRLQLPQEWLTRLPEEMATEAIERQHRDAAQREFLTAQLARGEAQRPKLLDAYYAGAIDVQTLKQERVGVNITSARDKLADLAEWQEILTLAGQFATRCADAYRKADEPTRRVFNAPVFEQLTVKDGRIAEISYRPPFDAIFSVPEFEYGKGPLLCGRLSWLRRRAPA